MEKSDPTLGPFFCQGNPYVCTAFLRRPVRYTHNTVTSAGVIPVITGLYIKKVPKFSWRMVLNRIIFWTWGVLGQIK